MPSALFVLESLKKLYQPCRVWYIFDKERTALTEGSAFHLLPAFANPSRRMLSGGKPMQRQPATRPAPFGGAPTPVQTAISFMLLSSVLVLVNAIALGVRTGAWKYLIGGFWYVVLVFWAIDQIIKLKQWAWWVAVVLSGLFSARAAIVAVEWLMVRQKGPGLDRQSFVFQLLCGLVLGVVFGELVSAPSRKAFGIHMWKRGPVYLAPALELDQVAIGVADKDLSKSR